ncbi:MAG: hypothetical protein RQ899_00675 [Pseudomonadales bacterium]|nr:hypothetical protein [Pseudomonadales bacterium]
MNNTMNEQYLNEHEVIHRYLVDKLPDDERDAFEVYLLEHPELLDEIEAARHIQNAFKANAGLLKKSRFPAWLTARSGQGLLAAAACLVVAVVIVFRLPQQNADLPLQPPVILETLRGQGDDIIQVSGTPLVQFLIDVGPPALSEELSYSLDIVQEADGSTLATAQGLHVDQDGWLLFSLSDQRTPLQGLYRVRVVQEGRNVMVGEYRVDFTAE